MLTVVSRAVVSSALALLGSFFVLSYLLIVNETPTSTSSDSTTVQILIEYSNLEESMMDSIRADLTFNCFEYDLARSDHKVMVCAATLSAREKIKDLIGEDRLHSITSYFNTYRKELTFVVTFIYNFVYNSISLVNAEILQTSSIRHHVLPTMPRAQLANARSSLIKSTTTCT